MKTISSFITDRNGYASQHLQYLPFGELFVEQRSTANYYTPYKFSGKEKDEETSYSYFGARYYMSDVSIWLSVDPMADEREWLSPYNYCQLNPIMRIDPDGAFDTDFGVTSSGEVRQIGPTNNEPDRLYAINNDGTKKNVAPVTVNDKTILPSLVKKDPKMKEAMYPDPGATRTGKYNPKTKEWTYTENRTMLQLYFGKSKSKSEAKKVFTFCATNSTVEWALAGFKNGDWLVGTLREDAQAPNFSANGSAYGFYNKLFNAHSHGGNDSRIDFQPSDNDISNARDLIKNNPNAQSWLFMPKNPNQKWKKL